jgi:hypothetical protein
MCSRPLDGQRRISKFKQEHQAAKPARARRSDRYSLQRSCVLGVDVSTAQGRMERCLQRFQRRHDATHGPVQFAGFFSQLPHSILAVTCYHHPITHSLQGLHGARPGAAGLDRSEVKVRVGQAAGITHGPTQVAQPLNCPSIGK